MFPVLWVLVVVLLAVFAIVMTFLYFRAIIVLTNPSTCLEAKGQYGVTANTDGTILNSSSGPCIFTFPTLGEAITQCNTLFTICTSFSYNQSSGTMRILNVNEPFVGSTNSNLYTRQANIELITA
jgi:hypothetical protein